MKIRVYDGWKLLAWIVAAAFLVALISSRQSNAYAEQRIAELTKQNDSLKRVEARIDTIYARDTVRLWRYVDRWDTIPEFVDRWKHDTVKVVEYVRLADSTIQACTAALLTCEQKQGLLQQRISVLEQREQAWQSMVPSRWDVTKRNVKTAAVAVAGWEIGKALVRIAAKPP